MRLLLSLALCLVALTGVLAQTTGLTSIDITSTNSSAFVFNVQFDGVTAGSPLDVLIEPADGNATKTTFSTIASPMEVVVSNLQPDTLVAFTFTLTDSANTSAVSTYPMINVRTHRLGPQIVAFFAQDTSAGDDSDKAFSNGDNIIIQFSDDTTEPGDLSSKAGIDALLSFSQPIGTAYHGEWTAPSALLITIDDIGQASPAVGKLLCTVIGDIRAADGLSDVSVSSSPPLIGSWANQDNAYLYFTPTDREGDAISNPTYLAYNTSTDINTNITLPMSLSFPAGAPTSGYMLAVLVVYPTEAMQVGFLLDGRNFSYGPSASIGTVGNMATAFLSAIVPTVSMVPRQDYSGYACVQYQLLDMTSTGGGYTSPVATAYLNVLVDAPAKLFIPTLTASSGSTMMNPIDLAAEHKTSLIIGLSVTFGVILLSILAFFGYKKYKGSRDARDFQSADMEEHEAIAEQPVGDAAGPTRRFYYDAKV